MDPPRFDDHYSALIRTMRACGLATPWIEKPTSLLRRLPYLIWDTLLVSMVTYMLLIYVYSLTTIHFSIQDLFALGISTASYVRALLLTLYHAVSGRRLRKITDKMDEISATIGETELGHADIHKEMYSKNAAFIKLLSKLSFRYNTFLPFIYCVLVPLSDLLHRRYRSRFPVKINSPFNDRQPGVYELLILVLGTCVTSTYAKKTATDCLIMALFRIQTNFLRYLSVTMTGIQQELQTSDNALVRRKLVIWVQLHQDVVKNIQDLVLIFSPVIIIYYVSVIVNIVCGAFIILKKDDESIFQSALVSFYMVVALAYQFLICDTAEQLRFEAHNLANLAYSAPWYDWDKSNADMVKMVITAGNRPIQVTAYRGPVFLLNRETFMGFIASAMSVFVTLCQMKDIYDDA